MKRTGEVTTSCFCTSLSGPLLNCPLKSVNEHIPEERREIHFFPLAGSPSWPPISSWQWWNSWNNYPSVFNNGGTPSSLGPTLGKDWDFSFQPTLKPMNLKNDTGGTMNWKHKVFSYKSYFKPLIWNVQCTWFVEDFLTATDAVIGQNTRLPNCIWSVIQIDLPCIPSWTLLTHSLLQDKGKKNSSFHPQQTHSVFHCHLPSRLDKITVINQLPASWKF